MTSRWPFPCDVTWFSQDPYMVGWIPLPFDLIIKTSTHVQWNIKPENPPPEYGHWDLTMLTHQEFKILRLCSEGLLTKEIAEKLNLSPLTIRKHRQNSYRKLELRSTQQIRSFLRMLSVRDLT